MADTESHAVAEVTPEVRAKRQEFYDRIGAEAMAPLWEVMKGLVPPEPRPSPRAQLWRYDTVRPYLMEAGALLTAEEAERRVLVLENPNFVGKSRATATLYAGIQLVLPGEIAPAHRHTASALRFVLESGGGHTSVGGERTTMRPGDFVITPSWAWHDHANQTRGPVLWMDILDVPMVNFFEAGFSQHHNEMAQPISRPENDALSRYGASLLPIEGEGPFGKTSPIFNYPYARTHAALAAVAMAGSLDPHWAATLRYANPIDGGWAMPTISSWMTHLPAGTATLPMRATDGVIVAVAEGRGVAQVGDQRIAFGPRDIFVLPNWTWRSFRAEGDCFLFCSSDRVAQEKLGLWREERAAG
jgi:gentisate 1,2-dioxygenase